jgi:hypothetical protein
MFYINGELVELTNDKADYKFADVVRDYKETIADALDKYGSHLVINTRIEPYPDKKTGHPRFPGTRGILLKTNLRRNNSVEEWAYSRTLLKKIDDVLQLETPNLLVQKGIHSINIKENPDLVYYLLNCGYVGRTRDEGRKFHIFDLTYTNKKQASQRRQEGEVVHLIYTAIPEDRLLVLAKSFGVSNTGIKDIETVREELYQLVLQGEKAKSSGLSGHRGFDEFKESSEVKFYDQVAALCKDAEDSQRLVYETGERRWVLDYKDGGSPYVLKQLSGDEYGDIIGSLVNFLLTAPDHLKKVEAIMGVNPTKGRPINEKAEVNLTIDDIQNMKSVQTLKKWIKERFPEIKTPNTMTGAEAREVLLTRLFASAEETSG